MADDEKINMGEQRTLQIQQLTGESKRDSLARTMLRPEVQAGASLSQLASGAFSDAGFAELVDALDAVTKRVSSGDIGRLEETLSAQGIVLDAIFNHLVMRATNNMGHYVETVELYMKLALRAQSQCRATLETLANLRRPQIRQTNIAHGHQQVNNFSEKQNRPNELLEQTDGMEPGTPQEAVSSDPPLAAVGEQHRSEDTRGQG